MFVCAKLNSFRFCVEWPRVFKMGPWKWDVFLSILNLIIDFLFKTIKYHMTEGHLKLQPVLIDCIESLIYQKTSTCKHLNANNMQINVGFGVNMLARDFERWKIQFVKSEAMWSAIALSAFKVDQCVALTHFPVNSVNIAFARCSSM